MFATAIRKVTATLTSQSATAPRLGIVQGTHLESAHSSRMPPADRICQGAQSELLATRRRGRTHSKSHRTTAASPPGRARQYTTYSSCLICDDSGSQNSDESTNTPLAAIPLESARRWCESQNPQLPAVTRTSTDICSEPEQVRHTHHHFGSVKEAEVCEIGFLAELQRLQAFTFILWALLGKDCHLIDLHGRTCTWSV